MTGYEYFHVIYIICKNKHFLKVIKNINTLYIELSTSYILEVYVKNL
jgi:hypothetical protein